MSSRAVLGFWPPLNFTYSSYCQKVRHKKKHDQATLVGLDFCIPSRGLCLKMQQLYLAKNELVQVPYVIHKYEQEC